MDKPRLTQADYERAAEHLGCSVAAIKAVAEVEARGDGFLPDGRVKILFERHWFSKLTNRSYDANYPDLSNRKPGGYKGGANEYDRFNRAFALDADAAMKSASWGKFQLMGFNHEACGFATVDEFVDAMKTGEPAQLDAFVNFLERENLARFLRTRDWANFAARYNGPNYAINAYDRKMAQAFDKHDAQEAA